MSISRFLHWKSWRRRTRDRSIANQISMISGQFDAKYYKETYPDLSETVDLVGHYIRHGWREGRNPAEWFSVRDYLTAYPDVAAAGIDPFAHYLRCGRIEGREAFPVESEDEAARRVFIQSSTMHLEEFPESFAALPYALAAGLGEANRWQALTHFVQHGMFNPVLFAVSGADANLLANIGHSTVQGEENKAKRCFEYAARLGTSDARTMHELGDRYQNQSQPFNAIVAYEASIALGGEYFWTHYNLAHALGQLGLYDSAIAHCNQALRMRPEKTIARYERNRFARDQFMVEWAHANALSIEEDDKAASERIALAIEAYRGVIASDEGELPFPCRGPRTGLRIAIFGSDSLSQCTLYRIKQKVDQLDVVNQRVDVFSLSQAEHFARRVALYDAAIIYRAPATPEVIEVLTLAKKFGVTTFYDIDDLIFDDSCYPPSRKALEGMVSASEYAGLVTGRALFREAMAMCDFGIASTPPIQDSMAGLVRERQCFLSRNALGRLHMAALKRKADDEQKGSANAQIPNGRAEIVFFYGSGSRSHNENFAILAPALAKIMRTHQHTRLRVFGPVELGVEFDCMKDRVERLGFTADLSSYWQALAEADINLAPLTQSAFNDGKSEIKWMEAAMLGVPSVVSASAVYDDLLRHGEDGWIARTAEDWYPILDRLVRQPEERVRIGAAARARVLVEYDLRSGGENLLAIIREGLMLRHVTLPSIPRKPRLLVVNIFYPPEFIGGATRVAEQIVSDIAATYGTEFDIEVLCGREPDGRPGRIDRYLWNGIPVTSVSPFTDGDSIERSVETSSFFDAYLDLVQPDIIHFHCIQRLTASLVDVAADRDIPFIVTVHDGWWISDCQFLIENNGVPVYESGNWGDPRRLERLRLALLRAKATVAVSRSQEQLYRQRGISNVVTISNGSDILPGVAPAPSEGPVWLGLMGGLGMAKGADLLHQVLASRHYRNLRFLVVDHSMLEGTSRIEMWGRNEVHIVGKTSFSNVAAVYSRLHVILAISVCVESFGLVAREARRHGRWVIASDRGGIGEDVVEGEDGFIIDPARMATLREVFDKIEVEPERYREPLPTSGNLRGRSAVAEDYAVLFRTILAEEAFDALS